MYFILCVHTLQKREGYLNLAKVISVVAEWHHVTEVKIESLVVWSNCPSILRFGWPFPNIGRTQHLASYNRYACAWQLTFALQGMGLRPAFVRTLTCISSTVSLQAAIVPMANLQQWAIFGVQDWSVPYKWDGLYNIGNHNSGCWCLRMCLSLALQWCDVAWERYLLNVAVFGPNISHCRWPFLCYSTSILTHFLT